MEQIPIELSMTSPPGSKQQACAIVLELAHVGPSAIQGLRMEKMDCTHTRLLVVVSASAGSGRSYSAGDCQGCQ
jgi:hypothetical protein